MYSNKNFDFIRLEQQLNVTNIISLFHYKYPIDFSFEGEKHDFWEFIFVDQGVLEISANYRTHLLKEGEILFHQPNEFHALRTCSTKPTSAVICSFTCDDGDMNFFRGLTTALHSHDRDILFNLLLLRSQIFFNDSVPFHSIPKPTEQIPEHYKQLVKNYIEVFLLSLMTADVNKTLFTKKSNVHSVTQNIIMYLNKNINRKLTLEEISVAVGYSIPHMKRVFHQDLSQGIIDYFAKLKIDEAKKMIDNNINLSEIANNLAFNDMAYFCRKFKQYEGKTPSEYRRSLSPNP